MKKIILCIPLLLTINYLSAQSICNVINSPGLISPGGDVVFDPDVANDSGYCIESSDVILDFGGFNISQDSGDPMAGFTGITVSPGLSNVTIRNGTIQGMTGMAIVIGEGCNNILIENITVIDCNAAGILFNGSSESIIEDGIIDNCLIYSCTGANGNPAYGLRLIYCDDITVQNCSFQRNDAASTNSGYGCSIEWCTTCNLFNCTADANGGLNLGVGYNVYNCQWCIVQNCNAMNTIARGTDPAAAVGFLIDTSDYTTVTDCICKHSNNTVAQAYGFEARNGTSNLFNNCEGNQSVGSTVAAGFYFNSTENASSILNCQSRINNGGSAGTGYGILLDTAQNCDIFNNYLINNTGLMGFGLEDTVVNTSNLIARNITFNNTTQGYSVSRTVGTFPSVTASLGDFSSTVTCIYINVDFVQ